MTYDSPDRRVRCWVAPIRNQPDGTQTDSNCDTTESDAAQSCTERTGCLPQLTLRAEKAGIVCDGSLKAIAHRRCGFKSRPSLHIKKRKRGLWVKIIDAGFEYFGLHDLGEDPVERVYKIIATAGRTCYKSEGSKGSEREFVTRIIERGHEAVLEHGNIILHCDRKTMDWFVRTIAWAEHRLRRTFYLRTTFQVVSGNVRAWRDFFKYIIELYPSAIPHFYPLMRKYDACFRDLWRSVDVCPERTEKVGKWREITVDELDDNEALVHRCETVRFIVDRGVSHEIVRHRPASYCQESTRYCNYSQDRFNGEITVIRPYPFTEETPSYGAWKRACEACEREYFNLLEIGELPEMARDVLPTSTKTEVVMTATVGEWRHFFNLRALGTTGRPHPQMREVALPLLRVMAGHLPALFGDLLEV